MFKLNGINGRRAATFCLDSLDRTNRISLPNS